MLAFGANPQCAELDFFCPAGQQLAGHSAADSAGSCTPCPTCGGRSLPSAAPFAGPRAAPHAAPDAQPEHGLVRDYYGSIECRGIEIHFAEE